MSSFRTIVSVIKPPFAIAHGDGIVSMGSCFSEHIGRNFERFKFDIDINPFGQQYNPASITTAIHRLLANIPYTATELIEQDGLYHSLDHHGSFSKAAAHETLDGINERLKTASENLKQAKVLFLTLGTAHAFKWKETGKVVSNCHKIANNQFDFELLSPEQIIVQLKGAMEALLAVNPNIKIVLTVSPVRYFAFGHFENTVSKGHLFTAINSLRAVFPQLYYFPAYEIMLDDLRDYRFYADDMLHPNHLAVQYIWDALCTSLLSDETTHALRQIDEIYVATQHRPRQPDSQQHKKFVATTLSKIGELEQKYGFDYKQERSKLSTYE